MMHSKCYSRITLLNTPDSTTPTHQVARGRTAHASARAAGARPPHENEGSFSRPASHAVRPVSASRCRHERPAQLGKVSIPRRKLDVLLFVRACRDASVYGLKLRPCMITSIPHPPPTPAAPPVWRRCQLFVFVFFFFFAAAAATSLVGWWLGRGREGLPLSARLFVLPVCLCVCVCWCRCLSLPQSRY